METRVDVKQILIGFCEIICHACGDYPADTVVDFHN